MQDAELALRRWKTIYDQLVQADRQLASCGPQEGADALALRRKIATLSRESDAALADLNRCVDTMNRKAAGGGAQRPDA
jgi:hypothetical protein